MVDRLPEEAAGEADQGPATRLDWFHDGRLLIHQPVRGYRSGTDAVLLAALTPVQEGAAGDPPVRVLDAGSGVGVVGLSVARRCANTHVVLVERAAALAALARRNIEANGLRERASVIEADLRTFPGGLGEDARFDHVLANPPFAVEGQGQRPENPIRAAAHMMEAGALEDWARFLARMARPDGILTLIHRADRLADLLALLAARFGGLTILPVQPFEAAPAHRIVIGGIKGSRAPLRLLAPLILHRPDGSFMPQVDGAMREGLPLSPPGWSF